MLSFLSPSPPQCECFHSFHLFDCLHRLVTLSSSAVPSLPSPTASLAMRPLSFFSSWTVCGRSFANFPALLNSTRVSWYCFSNTPTHLSLGHSWATVQLRGKIGVGWCKTFSLCQGYAFSCVMWVSIKSRCSPCSCEPPLIKQPWTSFPVGQSDTFLSFHRARLCLPEKTVSLWSWVNRPQELERLTNPLYEPNSLVIWPSVAPQSLLLWEGKKQIYS